MRSSHQRLIDISILFYIKTIRSGNFCSAQVICQRMVGQWWAYGSCVRRDGDIRMLPATNCIRISQRLGNMLMPPGNKRIRKFAQGMFDKHSSLDFIQMLTSIFSVGMLSLLLDELLWCGRVRFHIAARIRFRRVEVVLKNSAEVLNPSASTLRVWDQPNLRVVAWLFVASIPLMVLWRMRGRHRACACYYRLEGPWKSRSNKNIPTTSNDHRPEDSLVSRLWPLRKLALTYCFQQLGERWPSQIEEVFKRSSSWSVLHVELEDQEDQEDPEWLTKKCCACMVGFSDWRWYII